MSMENIYDATLPEAEVLAYAAKRGFDMAVTVVKPVLQDRFPGRLKLSGIFEHGKLVATLRKRRDGKYSYSNNIQTLKEA